MKVQAMKKSNRNSAYLLPFQFVAILTQGILKLDLAANIPRQPYSTRPLSKIFCFLFYSYKGKKQKYFITDTTTRGICEFS